MCGIVAAIGEIEGAQMWEAVRRLRHRGPDEERYRALEGAHAGHTRLRILDLSEAGAQPMANEDGRIVVVFNGEIFNFLSLREELRSRGHVFRSQSDTEVVVHGYEEWGDGVLSRLQGMFAFVAWDQDRQAGLAARDRLGKKPLVYASTEGPFHCFASEISALRALPMVSRSVSKSAMAQFARRGFFPGAHTVLEGVRRVRPGWAVTISKERVQEWRYDCREPASLFEGDIEEAAARAGAILDEAVKVRLVSDVPVAVLLSAGIDSGLVAESVSRQVPETVAAITVRPRSGSEGSDEGPEAAALARRCGFRHTEVLVDGNPIEALETIGRQKGEPFGLASIVPAFAVFKAARETGTVVLTGDGGDEVFGGYSHYRRARATSVIRDLVGRRGLAAARKMLEEAYGRTLRGRRLLKLALAALGEIDGSRCIDSDWEVKRIFPSLQWCEGAGTDEEAQQALWRVGLGAVRKSILIDILTELPDHMLVKVDTASMAFGVEARSPFLDERCVAFGMSLPERLLVQGRRSKPVLRHLARRRLGVEASHRPKTGFGVPIANWFQGPNSARVREYLLSDGSLYRSLVDRQAVESALARHAEARPRLTALLFRTLALAVWAETSGQDLAA